VVGPPESGTRAAWARAFSRQGRADLDTFMFLSALAEAPIPACHRLQFLQMACEKIAKANFSTSSQRTADRDVIERLDAEMPVTPEQATRRGLWVHRLLLEAPRLTGSRSPLDDDDILNELALNGEVLAEVSPDVIRRWPAHRLEKLDQLGAVPESISQNSQGLASWLGLKPRCRARCSRWRQPSVLPRCGYSAPSRAGSASRICLKRE
jgi:hypothetical protein